MDTYFSHGYWTNYCWFFCPIWFQEAHEAGWCSATVPFKVGFPKWDAALLRQPVLQHEPSQPEAVLVSLPAERKENEEQRLRWLQEGHQGKLINMVTETAPHMLDFVLKMTGHWPPSPLLILYMLHSVFLCILLLAKKRKFYYYFFIGCCLREKKASRPLFLAWIVKISTKWRCYLERRGKEMIQKKIL